MADVKEHIFGDVYADSINGPVLSCTSGDPFAPHTYASLVWDAGTSSFQVRTGDTTNPLIHPPISFLYRVESLYVPTQPTDLVRKNELDSMAMGAIWQKAVNEICDEATITQPLTIGKRYIALTTAGTWIKDHIYECLTVAPNTWRDDVPAPGWACLILDGTKWPDQTVIFVDATPGPSTWTPMGISLSHLDLTNIGTYTHAQIDAHINTIAGSDPHSGQDLHTTASPTFTGATFAKISPGPVLTFNNTSVTPSSLTMSLADSGSFDINASLGPIAFSATTPLIIYNTAEASYTAGLPPIITGSIITYGGIYSALRVYATNMTCTTAPVADTDVVRLVDIISGGIDIIPTSFTYLGVGRLAAGPPVVPGTNPNPPPAAPVPLVAKSVAGDGVLYQLGLIDTADRYCQIRSLEGTGDMTFLPFTDRDYIFDYNGTTTTGRILAKCSKNPGTMTVTNCGVVIGTSAQATGSLGVGGLCCEKFKICDTNHFNPTSGFILSASASGASGLAMLQFTNKGYVRPTYNPVFDMGDDMRINIPGSPAGSSYFSSTTPATGALTVLGGVGIRENLNIGNGATNSVLAFWKSGVSADKIAMSYSVGSPNDLTWTPNYTGARYVLGYSTSGGELIVQSPTNASATPTGAIQTSGGIYAARDEYIAGTTTTGGQLSSAVFIATYSNSLFANVAALITPTLSGAPVITGGKLDLTGYAARYVQYDAATNLAALNDLVTIRFLYTPNYGPAAPAQRQYMFSTSDGTVLDKNMIQIYHETDNTLWIRIYSAGRVARVNQSFGVQNAFTAGTEYEICLCFEGDSPPPPTGNTRLFINGVQFGPSVQSRADHTGVLTSMFIGKDSNVPSAAGNPNFYMRALSIYPAVLYTANYAAGTYSAVGETVYGAENVGSLRVTGLSYLANTTDATDLNTGALIDMGGASIAKNLHVGGTISIHGSNPIILDNNSGQLIISPTGTATNAIFGASFSKVFHAEIAAINGATIADTPLISANGYLDLQGATGPKYVGFSGTNISTLANMGTIRLRYIPHVASLPPATQQVLFSTGATLLNAIYVAHIYNAGTGRLIVSINSSIGVGGGTVSVSPAWTPTLGLEYEIEVDFQVSSPGFLYLFVNGALLASNTGTTFTRTGVVNGLYIGAPEHNLSSPGYYPDFLERDVVVWPTVQHIAAYTPTNYSVTSVTTGAISASGIYSQGIVANSMSCNNAATRPFDVLRVNDFITYAVIGGYWSATSGLPNSPMTFHLLKIGNLVMLTSTDKSTTVVTTGNPLALISYSVTSGSLVGMLPQGTSLRTVKYVTLGTTMSEVNMGFGDPDNHPVISFTFQLATGVNFSVGRISESWVL